MRSGFCESVGDLRPQQYPAPSHLICVSDNLDRAVGEDVDSSARNRVASLLHATRMILQSTHTRTHTLVFNVMLIFYASGAVPLIAVNVLVVLVEFAFG